MRVINTNQYTSDNLKGLSRIPFLHALAIQNAEQYQLLLKQTHIIQFESHEVLLEQGSEQSEFYAVISGRLDVLADNHVVGHVSAGQLSGVFSLLNNTPRSATLRASGVNGTNIIVINFRLFGELNDFSFFSVESKLCLYKEVEKFARWKLDAYVTLSQDGVMKTLLSNLQPFEGKRDSLEELTYLDDQVRRLSQLFTQMNKTYRT